MISVVVAAYNGEKYIIKQLESIKNQTLKVDEVIICDDCSKDSTVFKVEEYIKQNSAITEFNYVKDGVIYGTFLIAKENI